MQTYARTHALTHTHVYYIISVCNYIIKSVPVSFSLTHTLSLSLSHTHTRAHTHTHTHTRARTIFRISTEQKSLII